MEKHKFTLGLMIGLLATVVVQAGETDRLRDSRADVRQSQTRAVDERVVRTELTAQEMWTAQTPQLVNNTFFMPVGRTTKAAHRLSGTLHFLGGTMDTAHPEYVWQTNANNREFPQFSLPVLSEDGHFIPLNRELVFSGEWGLSSWNIICSPGKVWREAADGGYSRASFPFILTDNAVGQARNGLATFLFNDHEISQVMVQIVQETAPHDAYVIANFAAIIPATYTPQTFVNEAVLIDDFKQDLARRLPVHDWSELPDAASLEQQFNADLQEDSLSAAALVVDGKVYMQQCRSRRGDFPYPLEMRHGVFSVTKTMGLGLSMFYLAEAYGEGVFNERITDWIPSLRGHRGWQGVTFEHTLSMATGVSGTDNQIGSFIRKRSASARLEAVAAFPDDPAPPGTKFQYTSVNSFTLFYAATQFLRAQEGPQADLWQTVQREVLEPIGAQYLSVSRTKEADGSLGIPLMGWGAYPTVDEAAKIAILFHNEGAHEGRQLLNRNKVREALGRTNKRGYYSNENVYYDKSFWQLRVNLSAGCSFLVPNMLGHGGNFVMIMPSGVSAIRFYDANSYNVGGMISVAEALYSSCP